MGYADHYADDDGTLELLIRGSETNTERLDALEVSVREAEEDEEVWRGELVLTIEGFEPGEPVWQGTSRGRTP